MQELKEDDFDRCLEFCELMMEKDAEPDFVYNNIVYNNMFFQTKQRFNLTVMSIDIIVGFDQIQILIGHWNFILNTNRK